MRPMSFSARRMSTSCAAAAMTVLVLAAVASGAQALLSGRVVDGGGQGIQGVDVHLVNKDITATTGADGRFEIFDDATVRAATVASAMPAQVKLTGGSAEISTGNRAARISIGLYELRGRLVTRVFDDAVGPMQHLEIPLLPGRPSRGLASGVYVARIIVNGERSSVRSFNPGGTTTSAPLLIGRASDGLGKTSAAVDSVSFSKNGCVSKKLVVEQYNSDLGDVTMVCDGATVLPPESPKSYDLPSDATRVASSGELLSALSGSSAKDIVLADGTYDNSTCFHPAAAHRLWAEHLGGATLTAGILFDTGAGPEVHGVRFNVGNKSKVFNSRRDGAVIHTKGAAHGLKVTDCWFDGHGVIGNGIDAIAINGVTIQRVVITNFMSNGIRADDYPTKSAANPRVVITDADISNIKHSDPSCCNGQVEFGIHAGTTMTVERVKTRNTDWCGITPTVNCTHSIFRDIDIDGTNSASFYFEHFADNTLLERFHIGPDAGTGINFESAQDRWNWEPVGPYNVVRDGVIESRTIGVNVPYGTSHTTIQNVTFKGQCGAAIAHSAANAIGPLDGSAGATNKFIDNDYSGIKPGAAEIIEKHPNAISCD